MRKLLVASAAAVLTMTMLGGCGGDDSTPSSAGGYCGDLQDAKDSISGLFNDQISQDTFDKLRASMPTLRAEAPATLKDEWATFESALDTFSAALKKAGLTMDDMRDMGTGPMSGGPDMQTAMDAAAALGSAKLSTAQSRIAANAANVCDIDLNS